MSLFNLKGKTALITGASSGLGRRFAETLAISGAKVILAARNLEKLEAIANEIKNNDGEALAISLDVTQKTSIEAAMEKIYQKGENIDILINNAGSAKWTPLFLDQMDMFDAFDKGGIEVWDEIMNLNLRGLWLMTQNVSTHMKKEKIAGSIINIASTLGEHRPVSGAAASCISKAGVIHLTRQLVSELAEYNIRINSIIPGMFKTELTSEQLDRRGEEIKSRIPLGFVGEPEDLDGIILYLASNKASRYVTGSCITIDGGASWRGK